MKKYLSISFIFMAVIAIMTACADDIFSPTGESTGEKITLSLNYADASPKEIVVNTRTNNSEDERKIDNLYIYAFDSKGKLKGFKAISNDLNSQTDAESKTYGTVNEFKTTDGDTYFYAVANIDMALYKPQTTENTIESGKLPIKLDEDKAQDGDYNFTKDDLFSIPFISQNTTELTITSTHLMSGSADNGKAIKLEKDKTASVVIYLSKVVAHVTFNLSAASGKTFTLTSYEICNIANKNTLIGSEDDGNDKSVSDVNYFDHTGTPLSAKDKSFNFYLPENLQGVKSNITEWKEREEDGSETAKEFTNAPKDATYVVLHGKFTGPTDGEGSTVRTADVDYYIHLGDFGTSGSMGNFNVERNCKYTYNVTVTGVNSIVVEAKKETGYNPGSEGVVLDLTATGKSVQLDSHYEYVVMEFTQEEIKTLKKQKIGYFFQVSDPFGTSDLVCVDEKNKSYALNNATVDWIEFKLGGTYSSANANRGVPADYTWTGEKSNTIYGLYDFLYLLYSHADDTDNSFWGSDGKITATCFIGENYYANKTWAEYVNKPDRYVYIANLAYESKDGRSIYAKAKYGIHQYSIQTFYRTENASSVVAYGCETINDETVYDTAGENGKEYRTNFNTSTANVGSDTWFGYSNMKSSISSDTWESLKSDKTLAKACMYRNRDLNGDGKIDDNEIKWYAPTVAQLCGMWIGDNQISSAAKFYDKDPNTLSESNVSTRKLYYCADPKFCTFFAEEGMAMGNGGQDYSPQYVRCMRNLKSNEDGYNAQPNKYYTYDSNTRLMQLNQVATGALITTPNSKNYSAHTEVSELNMPAEKFYVANQFYQEKNTSYSGGGHHGGGSYYYTWSDVTYGQTALSAESINACKEYTQDNVSGDAWRVPNQRELCAMSLLLVDGTYSNSWLYTAGCRTKFRNTDFRYTWIVNGSNFVQMTTPSAGYIIKVRCVSPTK